MPQFSPLIDLPILIVTWAVVLSAAIYWLLKSSQDQVPRTQEVVARTAFRITLLFGFFGLGCWLVSVACWVAMATVPIIVFLGSGGPTSGPLWAPFFLAVMLTKEYVLGFPELVLSPPTEPRSQPATLRHPLQGRVGIALGPLCPQGDVDIDGEQHQAASENGTWIDAKTSVIVVGRKNGTVLVIANQPAA